MSPKAMTIEKNRCFHPQCRHPGVDCQRRIKQGKFTFGAGASLKYIKPTLYTVGISAGKDDKKYVSDDLLRSASFVGYAQYTKKMFTIRAKAVLGQNMTHLTMPGGYGVKSVDPSTGAMEYTPYNTLTSFINAVYGKKYQVGFFCRLPEKPGNNRCIIQLWDKQLSGCRNTRISPQCSIDVPTFASFFN
jgi:hypothetical protein